MTLRRRAALGIAALILALSGCSALPTSGPVESGPQIEGGAESDVVYTPNGPAAGDSQEQILQGFLDAGTGAQNNYATARQFLSSQFAGEWNPRERVLIRAGAGSITRDGDQSLTYAFRVDGAVSSEGNYTGSSVDTPSSSLDFDFVHENGEWRISSAPGGIVLAPVFFDQIFAPTSLYFFDPSYRYLVPDVRWFPEGDQTTTRVVSALLDGPADWLQGAVVNAFPDGTRLGELDPIRVDSGVASIDLSNEVLAANEVSRQRMLDQLTESLRSGTPDVMSVRLSVERNALATGGDGISDAIVDPVVDDRPLVVDDGAFGYWENGGVEPVTGLSEVVAALDPRSVALARGGGIAAIGTGGATLRAVAGREPQVLDNRPGLVAPSIDDRGDVWSIAAEEPGTALVFGPDGEATTVSTSLPAGSRVIDLEVARDGARVAMLVEVSGETSLFVAGVLRDAEGPVSLTSALRIALGGDTALDAAWTDESTVAVLVDDGEDRLVLLQTVGGGVERLGSPGEATAVAGTDGADTVVAILDSGELRRPQLTGWQDLGDPVDVLGVQH